MATILQHNGEGPIGVYQGRHGGYEVSLRDDPMHMRTEVVMCFQGMCVAQTFNEYELHKRHHGGSLRDIVFHEVARLLDLKIEENTHTSMVAMSAEMGSHTNEMHSPHRSADIQRRINGANRLQDGYHRRMVESMRVPAHMMGARKKPAKLKGSLREQLQAETDEWLKDVRAA